MLRFDSFMEMALYGVPGGFYTSAGQAGRRRGDFLTSVEVGPLFGRLVAELADRTWDDLGRPRNFSFVDAGAGTGTLARAVLAAAPRCSSCLRYVLVERSAVLRCGGDDLAERARPLGAQIESLEDLPESPITGLVFANELLDNLPVRLLERTTEGWCEVYVEEVSASTARPRSGGRLPASLPSGAAPAFPSESRWQEILRPLPAADGDLAEALAPGAPQGARLPLATAAVDWVGRALELIHEGRLIVIDYADVSASLAARPPGEWLRTYRRQAAGGSPLREVGQQDITVDIPLDQILSAHPGATVRDQASFLRSLGIEALVAEGASIWQQRAAVGDLLALEARSRSFEAESLCNSSGLGAFSVVEWRTP